MERFWNKVEQRREHECWLWHGARTAGYGQIVLSGKSVPAHRFAYETRVGPIPEGLVLDHLCRNPSCVNPSHLEPVTNRENVLRGVGVTATNSRKTHCKRGHAFTPENTYVVPRTGSRQCKDCRKVARRNAARAKSGIVDSPEKWRV